MAGRAWDNLIPSGPLQQGLIAPSYSTFRKLPDIETSGLDPTKHPKKAQLLYVDALKQYNLARRQQQFARMLLCTPFCHFIIVSLHDLLGNLPLQISLLETHINIHSYTPPRDYLRINEDNSCPCAWVFILLDFVFEVIWRA